MRLIFIGNIQVSLEILKTIRKLDKDILVGIITNRNKKPDSAESTYFPKNLGFLIFNKKC